MKYVGKKVCAGMAALTLAVFVWTDTGFAAQMGTVSQEQSANVKAVTVSETPLGEVSENPSETPSGNPSETPSGNPSETPSDDPLETIPENQPEKEPVMVKEIRLSQTEAVLKVGKTASLTAEVLPRDADKKELIWTSSNEEVAQVSSKGKITARKKGEAVVTAVSTDGSQIAASCKVVVREKMVTAVKLEQTGVSLGIGQTFQIRVKSVKPETADVKDMIYTSSDPNIAAVSSKGKVTAKGPGKAAITVAAADGSGTTAEFAVTVRKYQRDGKYYQIEDEIVLPDGGYSLSTKNIGLKVIKINKKLLKKSSDRYTYATRNAVRRFQKKKGLKVTGIVNKKTWLKLGFSEKDWYNLGTYRTPMKVNLKSSKKDYTSAMLKTAKEYAGAGTAYRVGCSGKPGTYVDCSGLIYQCLYSAGINPETNIVDHALARYEYTSRWLAKDPKLGKRISYSKKKPGDIVFYCKSRGSVVVHVGIYAGGGKIYDSWPGIGVTKRSISIRGYRVSKIVRVF